MFFTTEKNEDTEKIQVWGKRGCYEGDVFYHGENLPVRHSSWSDGGRKPSIWGKSCDEVSKNSIYVSSYRGF